MNTGMLSFSNGTYLSYLSARLQNLQPIVDETSKIFKDVEAQLDSHRQVLYQVNFSQILNIRPVCNLGLNNIRPVCNTCTAICSVLD